MKKIYFAFAIAMSSLTVGNAQTTLISDDFESHEVGTYYASPWLNWDLSDNTDLNLMVTDVRASSGTKSGFIGPSNSGNGQDVFLTTGTTYSTGQYTAQWKMYVPSDSFAYFNLQETATPGGSYGYDALLNTYDENDTLSDGTSLAQNIVWTFTSGSSSYLYAYAPIPLDEWFTLKQVFDLDAGTMNLYVNDVEVTYYQTNLSNSWPGSLGSFGGFDLYSLPNSSVDSTLTGGEKNTMYIDDVTFVNNTVTGTNNVNSISNKFKFYPNPAHNELNIVGSEKISNIEIYDLTGKLVYSNAPESVSTQIKLNGMAAGNYFAKVNVKGEVFTKKITVK